MLSAAEIRQQFIDFFVKKHGHTAVPSAPVVPLDDPTLLFTNAGMNQFKDVFLGTGKRPYERAVDTQKCIRAGGKHNDLDDVGKDTYHHTFFEMLGNWSFGGGPHGYFKKEAIQWAWELLTKEWQLDKSRLHATVFEGSPDEGVPRDDEALEYWKTLTDIDPKHIHLGNKKDNFWEMGETGPCGPCTEIHYDNTKDKSGAKLVNAGTPDVIEIWNLVFIQYNSTFPDPKGLEILFEWDRANDELKKRMGFASRDAILAKYRKLEPLPAKHVDTGMGFERITAVLQGKESNYDTDVFTPIFDSIQKVTGAKKYSGDLRDLTDISYRVIADHIRCLTFAITDGAIPSNDTRGSVLRSILRRAERFGWQYLSTTEPFLYQLVDQIVEIMGGVFSELNRNPERVKSVIFDEEQQCLATLERGVKLFQRAAANAIGRSIAESRGHEFEGWGLGEWVDDPTKGAFPQFGLNFKNLEQSIRLPGTIPEVREWIARECNLKPVISGKDAFDLHTEQGLFVDIIEQMAAEIGIDVDRENYEQLFLTFRETSGKDRKRHVISAVKGELPPTDDSAKYTSEPIEATVLGWVAGNTVHREGAVPRSEPVALVLDRTNFYAEQGGQVGDKGDIQWPDGRFAVEDTQRLGEAVLHFGQYAYGQLAVGTKVRLMVAPIRWDTMRNHTATHLMNWALRKVLGDHIEQKGSLVDADKTRFDFTHPGPIAPEELAEIERLVNEKIYLDQEVTARLMPLDDARKISGVRAVFGEKYPDPVRVLMIGADAPEKATIENSVEFCGGTHLRHTGEAGFFKIVSQEGVAKGVRRVTATTGKRAVEHVQQLAGVVGALTDRLNCKADELPTRVQQLQDELKKLQTQFKKGAASDLAGAADKLLEQAVEKNGAKIIVGEIPAGDTEQIRQQLDRLRQKAGSAIVLIGYADAGKVMLNAAVTDDLVKKGAHAGKLIGQVAKIVGGGGGGKPTMAQAGGKEPAKLADALELGKKIASEQLNG